MPFFILNVYMESILVEIDTDERDILHVVKDVCHEVGISEASYYNWKAKYGGMDVFDIKKVKVVVSNRS